VLSGGVLSTVFIPDTEEVTGSIPVSPTSTKRAKPVGMGRFRGHNSRQITRRTSLPTRVGRTSASWRSPYFALLRWTMAS
jgi:hypothetical protein